MYAVLKSFGLKGLNGFPVEVEADISGGMPALSIVGLPDSAVRESGDRVHAALKNLGFKWPDRRITINLAPADVRKTGPVYDLPLLLAVLAASGQLETPPKDTAFLGELALDGSLRVYSKDNGKLLTDTTVEPVEHQQRVRMSNCGSGYVWLELQDNDRYETTATRLYGPQGLVSDLTALQGKYSYVNYLTTDPDGRPMFCGSRAAAGSAYGNVYDVLDADGNVVLQGLSSCTGYYSNSLNALPDHVFAAQRGFYVGWMDTSGNWLYCQSIFSSATADDVPSYGY